MRASDLITRQIEAIHERYAGPMGSEVATYIPELASANPDQFGIALASRAGGVYTAGDADTTFTIQSVSKPFVYAMALTDLGLNTVSERVGAEPSGEAFNAISLDPIAGRPANPMINAGAIVTTSLIAAPNVAEQFERIRAIAACRALSEQFDLHLLRQPNRPEPALDPHAIEHPGTAVRTLHGHISFADAEGLLRSLEFLQPNDRSKRLDRVVIDLTAVRSACRAASTLLAALGQVLTEDGVPLIVVGDAIAMPSARTVPSLDAALRWLNDRDSEDHGSDN